MEEDTSPPSFEALMVDLTMFEEPLLKNPEKEVHLRDGLLVREGDDGEFLGPFEGLHPLPNGSLDNPFLFIFVLIHVPLCFCC